MTASNFSAGLAFVWQPNFDSPDQGYHSTPGDAGGGTFGGVIEDTWEPAVARGLVTGTLKNATRDQLATVLRDEFWGAACDALPPGVDLMLFNGRMLTGAYPHIFQECLGLIGVDVDGDIGPDTLAAAVKADLATLVNALTGVHYAYLRELPSWAEFGGGWTTRLRAAQSTALAIIRGSNPAA